jgi:hypothetical protein
MYEDACTKLHDALKNMPRYTFPGLLGELPSNGVYFVFESGQEGHGGERIVLIGSHTGEGNLAPRLREHMRLNKDRSILRKHLGRAMLQRDGDPYLAIWNLDFTTRETRELHGHRIESGKQEAVEEAVSKYIETNFTVTVLPTESADKAGRLKRLCIGTVSSCSLCSPSLDWLGKHAASGISQSGLWEVLDLYGKGFDEADPLPIPPPASTIPGAM